MDEILKRLNEIKAEAQALAADDPERLAKLRELKIERDKLVVELAEVREAEAALSAIDDVPEPEAPAEDGGEGDEADDDAEDGNEDEGDDKPHEEEAPAADVALAASAAAPVDTDLSVSAHDDKPIVLTASGNVAGLNPGDTLGARQIERIHRHAASTRPGKGSIRSIFASMQVADGPALSSSNTAAQNAALMASASMENPAVKPITAAAAFCGPDDIVLDICAAGTDARPVQGLFRTVPVRGKFVYMPTATLADVSSGIGDGTGGVWEEADQLAVESDDPDTFKPCVDLTCRGENTVTPYAIPACAKIGTWQQLSAPEQVANWLTQMQKQYSRVAETQLLNRIRAQSYVYSSGNDLGLWSALQPLLANVAADVAAVNRGTTEGYVIVAPYGTLNALAADEVMKGFSQNLAKQRVQQLLLENYGMRIVESLETDSTVAAAYRTGATDLGTKTLGTSTEFVPSDASPDTTPFYVFRPDSFVAGSTDIVDAGYYRDANLVRQNLVQYFWEGMEFLEKTCDHLSFVFDLDNCPSGKATALVDGPDCNPVELG